MHKELETLTIDEIDHIAAIATESIADIHRRYRWKTQAPNISSGMVRAVIAAYFDMQLQTEKSTDST
jgi:hypothetical protein